MILRPSSPPFRVAVDLQALQTPGSRHRGIGRYASALLQAMLQRPVANIEYRFYANSFLPAPEFDTGGYPVHMVPFNLVAEAARVKASRSDAAICEALYTARLLGDRVDAIFLPSPMEMGDSVVPDFGTAPIRLYTVCYDLIPLLYAKTELGNPQIHDLYHHRLRNIRYSDGVFAISQATRADTVRLLKVPEEKAHTIYAGVSSFFRVLPETDRVEWSKRLQEKFGIGDRFLLYNGGENWRKNNEGLIQAFGKLPRAIRDSYQLVLACRLSTDYAAALRDLAGRCGVRTSVILTNFVSDDELRALFNLCSLFVFPSLHEGFGLPLLEAMACGAAVITADNSSLPEVVGDADVLFDGASPVDMARKIAESLGSESLLQERRKRAPEQAEKFNWGRCAELLLPPLAADLERGAPDANCALYRTDTAAPSRKPRIAQLSPLPPAPSGISDYTAELARPLAEHWDIRPVLAGDHPPLIDAGSPPLTVGTFGSMLTTINREDVVPCDAIVYQMGNGSLHAEMYAQLLKYAGVTVLHDYNLNNLLGYLGSQRTDLGVSLEREVQHHYLDDRDQSEILAILKSGDHRQIEKLPEQERFTNRRIFTRSLGVILHSDWAYKRAVQEFGKDCELIARIPQLMSTVARESLPSGVARSALRSRLHLPDSAFVVTTVGYVHASKRAVQLLDGFRQFLTVCPDAYLLFAGSDKAFAGDFTQEIVRRGLEKRVIVSGYVSMESLYEHVDAADVCISLRYPSNGETSAGLLRILSRAKACIISAIGSFTDYPESVCHRIPAVPQMTMDEPATIAAALKTLYENNEYRRGLAEAAYEYVRREHDPARCAVLYAEFLEAVQKHPGTHDRLFADYAGREAGQALVAARRWGMGSNREAIVKAFHAAVRGGI